MIIYIHLNLNLKNDMFQYLQINNIQWFDVKFFMIFLLLIISDYRLTIKINMTIASFAMKEND
jgi:hypothetical protein